MAELIKDYDGITIDGSDYATITSSDGLLFDKSVEKTITGNGKIEFTGNRNRAVKEMLFEGFCQQDGTPSPDNPAPIKVNDSVWVSSGVNIYNKDETKITTLANFLNVKKPMPCTANIVSWYTALSTVTFSAGCNSIVIPCKKGDTFVASIFGTITNYRKYYCEVDKNGLTLYERRYYDENSIITAENDDCAFMCIEWSIDQPDNAQIVVTRGSTVPSQYEPYIDGGSVDLSGIKLGGIGAAKNTYEAQTGAHVKKIGDIDLGSLNYSYVTSSAVAPYFTAKIVGIKPNGSSSSTLANALCDMYQQVIRRVDTFVDGLFCISGEYVEIKNANYTDKETFKSAMNGVKLYYELAEPVTETLTPQPITQRKGTNTITQVGGSVSDTAVTAKIYGFPYESASLKFAQHAVNSNIAKDLLPIGAELSDTWRTYDAPWRVVHHYPTGNAMALEWKWATPDGEVFDEPEAIYYAAEGLAAGTYNITVGSNMGAGWIKDQSIQFTLAKAVPAGGQICIDCGKNQANNPTDGRTLTVYTTKGGTTVSETTTTSSGTEGTNLGSTSTVNAYRTNGYINSQARVVYGYHRWSQSSKRQWLNSDEIAGNWWTAQNNWDRPPEEAATKAGFLHDASANLLSVLKPVNVVTALNTVEGFTDTYEITDDKIFLSSLQEMYVNTQIAGVEGVDWLYYKRLAEENGLTGRIPTGTAIDWTKKYRVDNHNTAVYVWKRSPYRTNASDVFSVRNTGLISSTFSYADYRACPACILHDGTYQPVVPQ